MILMPPMCGIFFFVGGGGTGSNTVDSYAEEQRQVHRGLSAQHLYDHATFEAKKMIVNQLIRRVDVYRGYQISVSFNFNLSQYFEGIDSTAC